MYSYFNGTAINLKNAKLFTVKPLDDDQWGIFVTNWNDEELLLGNYESEDSANYAFNAFLDAIDEPVYDMLTDTDYSDFVDRTEREAAFKRSRDEFMKSVGKEVERLFI